MSKPSGHCFFCENAVENLYKTRPGTPANACKSCRDRIIESEHEEARSQNEQ